MSSVSGTKGQKHISYYITVSHPLGTQQCAPVNEGKNKYIRQPFSQGAQRITLLILDTILLFIQSETAVLFWKATTY